MDFFRRAWLFTKARISRTILLIVAFTAILVFVFSGLIINSAASRSLANAKKDTGSTVTLSINRQVAIQKAASSSGTGTQAHFTLPTIPETIAQKVVALSEVKSYSFTMTATADADTGITPVQSTATGSTSSSSSAATGRGNGAGGGMASTFRAQAGDFQLEGTNELANLSIFSAGTNKIVSGRGITASDNGTGNVVIEETLANQNNLKVGSTFSVKQGTGSVYVNLTVVGIYQSNATTNSLAQNFNFLNPSNQMYVSLSVANFIQGTTGQINSAVYTLNDPAQTNNFVSQATKLVNSDTYQVESNDAIYQQMLTPLNNVGSFAKNIVILVAIAGAIILALIVMLMVRERRFEIGVLMSLGESRFKIVAQFFTELFMVMIVSVVLATVSGNFVGNVVGQQLLKQEQQTVQTSNQNSYGAGNRTSVNGNANGQTRGFGAAMRSAFGFGQSRAQAQAINKLNVKTTWQQVALLVGIAVLITLVAVGLASIGILRLNPKQVLTN